MSQSEQFDHCNRLIEKSKNRKFLFTLKAWPVIAIATIGLCFATQGVAKLMGIELPEQTNIEIVKRLAGWNGRFALLVLQIIVILPALEECLFRLPTRWLRPWGWSVGFSILFSAAHYIAQPWPDNAFLALFFFGVAQCWLYRKTERLWCAILNHALFNLTNLVLLFVVPEAS